MRRDRNGMSLPELLIALVVVGMLFSILIAFFSFQSRTSRTVQATNETNVRLRSAGEVVVRDLQLAGGRAVVVGGRPSYINEVLDLCDNEVVRDGEPVKIYDDCVRIATSGSAVTMTIYYASSLWPAGERCRRIVYGFDPSGGTPTSLHRADTLCTETATPAWDFGTEFATGLTSFAPTFMCGAAVVDGNSDGTPDTGPVEDPRECYSAESYVRTGTIAIDGESDARSDYDGTIELTTNMPNVRNPVDFSATAGDEVSEGEEGAL